MLHKTNTLNQGENMNRGMKQKSSYVIAAVTALMVMGSMSGCSKTPPPPPEESSAFVHEEGVAGGAIVNTLKMSVKVVAVDKEKRTLRLLDSDGKEFDVKAGKEVVNFDQIFPDDMVSITVTEELVVGVNESDDTVLQGSAEAVALAPKGAKPGGIVAGTRVITADIVSIDTTARTATMEFENGEQKTYPVRDDVDLTRYRAGQQVVIQMTEMVAISVKKPAPEEK